MGGHASLEAIKRHEWANYEAKPVRIIASRFIQLDPMIGPCYFSLKAPRVHPRLTGEA